MNYKHIPTIYIEDNYYVTASTLNHLILKCNTYNIPYILHYYSLKSLIRNNLTQYQKNT